MHEITIWLDNSVDINRIDRIELYNRADDECDDACLDILGTVQLTLWNSNGALLETMAHEFTDSTKAVSVWEMKKGLSCLVILF